MTPLIDVSLWFNNCFQFLQRFTTRKNWRIKLIALLTVTSLFFSSPPYLFIPASFKTPYWKSFEEKKEHPLAILNYPVGSHMEKKNYRLTMPIIARIFHLNDQVVYALQFVASALFLFIALLLTERITGDQVSGILTSIGLTFIYTGHAGFIDMKAWFDEFAYLFLLLAMFSKKPYWVFCCIQLACWVDERAIIASSGVFIWWRLQELTLKGFTLKSFFRVGLNSSFTFISVIVYFVVRILIKLIFHIPSPHGNVGFQSIFLNTDFYGMGLWEALEGFWILAIVAIILLYIDSKPFLLFLILAFMSVVMITAFSVGDVTRSAAYIFPVIFILLFIVKDRLSIENIRKILLLSSTICFISPTYEVLSPRVFWSKPIVVRIIDFIKHKIYGYSPLIDAI